MLMSNRTEVIFQVDTGSTVNVLLACFHPSDLTLNPVKKTLHAWNEGKVTALGTYRHTLRCPLNRKKYSIDFVIMKENYTPILGLKASTALQFVTINDDTFNRVASIKEDQYQEVFDRELGIIPGRHKLRVDPSIQPVVMPDHRVPIAVRPKLKEELHRMVSLSVITSVDEPTPWVSQIVITRKKSGAVRACIDPIELNHALLCEHYTLHELNTSKLFTKADLSQGYWHIPLDYESSILTTFNTYLGRYRWKRLPFGIGVSSEVFQKQLHEALEEVQGVVCIAHDIIIHGKDAENHDQNLNAFLQHYLDVGIKLNKEKLELQTHAITFLGHRISGIGLKADPEKVKTIKEMEPPSNVSQLCTYIGMANYMAKFLPNLSETLKPVTNLTKKDVQWNWSENEKLAFDKVKLKLTSAPLLTFYDATKPLILENDASKYGLGSILRQDGRPLGYASCILTGMEQRYGQIEKEILAVTFGLEKFHHYTYGRHLQVITDHKPRVSIIDKPLSKAPK